MLNRIQPRRSLAQHFLLNQTIAQRIANAIGSDDSCIIVEIGAGTGSLTEYLLRQQVHQLIAIEIDRRAVAILQNRFGRHPQFRVIEGDVLSFVLDEIEIPTGFRLHIVGNLPYNISGRVIFWMLEQADRIERIVIMVQKEVAQRIVAQAGSKVYGILSVATSLVARTSRILFEIPPGSFYPRPQVRSAVVEIVCNGVSLCHPSIKQTMDLVKVAFNQRRKKLRNALENYVRGICGGDESILNLPILQQRAEQLSPSAFIELADMIHTCMQKG